MSVFAFFHRYFCYKLLAKLAVKLNDIPVSG